ncbi:unnamed protein product [Alopecurus aequalis]
MAALRSAARKLLLQRAQASVVSPDVERRLVPRLIHTGPCAYGAPNSCATKISNIQKDPKIIPAFKPDWDTTKDITDPDDMDALVERLQLIKSKTEELYELSSGIERYVTGRGYHARFNRKLLWYLSSLVDERPNDPVWRQMQRKRRISTALKFAVILYLSVLISRYPEEEKTAPVQD